MNFPVSAAQIEQWYRNLDTGEMFFVTGHDEKSRAIEIQNLDGNVSEVDEETWGTLRLELADQPDLDTEEPDNLDEAYPDDLNSPVERIAFGESPGE